MNRLIRKIIASWLAHRAYRSMPRDFTERKHAIAAARMRHQSRETIIRQQRAAMTELLSAGRYEALRASIRRAGDGA